MSTIGVTQILTCTLRNVCRQSTGALVITRSQDDFSFNFSAWHGSEFHPQRVSLSQLIADAAQKDSGLLKKMLQKALNSM